ncbi:hypothetical protein PM082_000477 [Marasmius tenuissimus]|nr:hypothetical protein PM082_000477 [Marasmius tenuissimus]
MSTPTSQPSPTATLVLSSFCADNFYYCHLSQYMKPFVASCAAFLLYGVYVVLFVISIWILPTASLAMTIAVALLSDQLNGLRTGIAAVTWSFQGIPRESWPPITVDANFNKSLPEGAEGRLQLLASNLQGALQIMTVSSNVITDIILLWRCYLVWGRRYWVIILPSLLCLANNVVGILTLTPWSLGHGLAFDFGLSTIPQGQLHTKTTDHDRFIISFAFGSFCTNIILTGLIAGRIFHIGHRVAKLGVQRVDPSCIKPSFTRRWNRGCYTPLISSLVLQTFLKMSYNFLIMIMGIASTLIIVRSALGITIQDEETFKATVMRQSWDVTHEETTGMQMNVLNLNVRSINHSRMEDHDVEQSGAKTKES